MTAVTIQRLTEQLGTALQEHADAKTRDWWERYLKGEASFRGVKMAATRSVVKALVAQHHLRTTDADQMLAIARHWFAQPASEDKLAAVLLLGEHCLDALTIDHLADLAAPLADGSVHDWNVCDWYCVKVLGPFITAGTDSAERARGIAAWAEVDHLWQRRAAAVAFVYHAAEEPEVFDGITDVMLAVSSTNAADERRWAQTSVGWLLRELSRREPDLVTGFLDGHPHLSREARTNASKYLT
ncbi:MAG: DNA alkylation repair protein [Actinomycetota bacterium]